MESNQIKAADLILGVYAGNEASIDTLENIFRHALRSFEGLELYSKDIFQTILEKILTDERGILTRARKQPENINRSYLYTWIRWMIYDSIRELNLNSSIELPILDENLNDDQEEDDGYTRIDTIFYERDNIENKILAQELCEHLKKFVQSLSQQDKVIICARLGYTEIEDTDLSISRSNFDVRVYRIKKQLSKHFQQLGMVYGQKTILELIDSEALKDCSIADICSQI